MIYCGWGYLTGRMRNARRVELGREGYREIAGYAQRESGLILASNRSTASGIAFHQHRADAMNSFAMSECRT